MRKDSMVPITASALRFLLGWFMFFAGIEKVLDPSWSASRFLATAKTFPEFYAWLALPQNLAWVDPLNAWAITLIGVALLLGVSVRLASIGGAILMILYYFPHFGYPFIFEHGFIVEEHIIYAAAFLLVALMPEAKQFGLGNWLRRTALGRIPIVRSFL